MKKFLLIMMCLLSISPIFARDWKTSFGYRGNVETGYLVGTGKYGESQWILQTTHGVQVIPTYLFVGAGVGVGVFTDKGTTMKYSTQLYGDARCHFLKGKWSPFVDMKLGFEWNRNKNEGPVYDIQDGFYFSPAVGINYELTKIFSLDLSVGYTLNTAPVYHRYESEKETRNIENIGGVTFRVGFNF